LLNFSFLGAAGAAAADPALPDPDPGVALILVPIEACWRQQQLYYATVVFVFFIIIF